MAFKYLLHLVLFKPDVEASSTGLSGWMPMRHRALGAIAVRMNYGEEKLAINNTIAQ
jgi:hypothetical protein